MVRLAVLRRPGRRHELPVRRFPSTLSTDSGPRHACGRPRDDAAAASAVGAGLCAPRSGFRTNSDAAPPLPRAGLAHDASFHKQREHQQYHNISNNNFNTNFIRARAADDLVGRAAASTVWKPLVAACYCALDNDDKICVVLWPPSSTTRGGARPSLPRLCWPRWP